MQRIAGWSARYSKTTVLGWLVLVGVIYLAGQAIGIRSVPSYDAGPSGQAEQTLQRLGVTTPAVEDVLIQAGAGGQTLATGAAMRQAVQQVASALAGLPGAAADIRSPLTASNRALVSADGRSALITFQVPGPVADNATAVAPALRAVAAVQADHPGLFIAEAGPASYQRALNSVLDSGFRRAEVTSAPITLLMLVVVFGALIAAGIPLLLAVTSVMTALSMLNVASNWLPAGSVTSEVVLIIGMAVGVDYSLFYLRREREARGEGASLGEALRTAAATSGQAILISGLTVMMALAGLFLVDYDVFTGIAFGTIAVVGIAVLGSLTVLPALLSWLGPWADRGRIPFLGRWRVAARPSRAWAGLARRVARRPLVWGGAAAIALLVLAVPALGMRFGSPATDLRPSSPVQQATDRIEAAFPQASSPAQVVVTGKNFTGAAMRDVTAALNAQVSAPAARGMFGDSVLATPVADGRALIVDVQLPGNGANARSNDALLILRDKVLPAALGKIGGISYAVSGGTAENYDDNAALRAGTPVVVAFVAVMAFFVLFLAFRSVVIPLISIVLNLLSVGAGYGLITLIFQDGRLQSLLGYTSFGGIIPWIPLFMFVLLFGLSMDYHVFILSRIRELRARGASAHDAVVGGISTSAGVVTSAGLIMVAVFSILATLPVVEAKTLGVGLAAAVLIDATIVRGILLPAALALVGESWRPRRLGRHWAAVTGSRWSRLVPGVPKSRHSR
ncbi:MAG: MMPL family transporter [Streptosporangiaceae bacterium]